ncbi:MAG: hypothetical protein AB1426_10175 [Bacillota bacterium]
MSKSYTENQAVNHGVEAVHDAVRLRVDRLYSEFAAGGQIQNPVRPV